MKQIVCGVVTTLALAGSYSTLQADFFEDFDQEFNHIEKSLEQMHERLLKQMPTRKSVILNTNGQDENIYSSRLEMTPCKIHVAEDDKTVIITAQIDKKIEPSNVQVQLEGDTLTIAIPADDTLEIQINDRSITYSSHQVIEHEKKDEKNQIYFVSSGAAQVSQSALFPARVSLAKTPQVDLTDGILTIRLEKQNQQSKIIVTSSNKIPSETPSKPTKNRSSKKVKLTDEK